MKYDFDKIINRKNSYSCKWDTKENELPMWIADMDFETAPKIIEELHKRVDNGAFGYTYVPPEWNQAYSSWWERRHHYKIDEDSLIFSTGVVPSLSTLVRKLTTPHENVVLLTPVYNIFYNSVINNGRRVLECPLLYKDGSYEINWIDLENKLSDSETTLLIFCNPHNPVGKIWSKEEIERVGELCKENNTLVISDEIHCDLTRPGKEYIPFASVNETNSNISITCIAPTKCFNLAGLSSSAMFTSNKALFNKANRAINTDECGEPNAFAITATLTAFNECEDWLDELREYIFENRDIAEKYIKENIPEIIPVKGDATYLMWLDASFLNSDNKLSERIREKTGLWLSEGSHYGQGGEGFLRMNIACPRSMLMDGLERLKKGCK